MMIFKKRLLIVANTIKIKGVEADIENYYDFFTSEIGGEWLDSEIKIERNLTAAEFHKIIQKYRDMSLDYFVFVFCGHGGTMDDVLEMQLSSPYQTATEYQIKFVADRQLNIFDCCRGTEDDDDPEPITESTTVCFSDDKIGNVRERYKTRILQAIPQCSSLYACSIGEYAGCSSKGGFFSQYLLQSARKLDGALNKTIGKCITEASDKMERYHPEQTPDYALPRCLPSKSLILSIHP